MLRIGNRATLILVLAMGWVWIGGGQATAQTYDATGPWVFVTAGNYASQGCTPYPDESWSVSVVQADTWVQTTRSGIVGIGTVSGAEYQTLSDIQEAGGAKSEIISFALTSVSTGAGFIFWDWSDGVTFCSGGSTVSVQRNTQSNPVVPTGPMVDPNGNLVWDFNNITCPDGCWVDPPIVNGYAYATDGASVFTSIDDFPTGFAADFEVLVGGVSQGFFGPGDAVDFTSQPGGGVVAFDIRGINPGVDAADMLAFPLQVSFSETTVSFTMTSLSAEISVPALPMAGRALLVLLMAGGPLALRRRVRGRS